MIFSFFIFFISSIEHCRDSTASDGSSWYDSNGSGYGCKWYSVHRARCETFGRKHSNMGCVAKDACCVCGGGNGTAPSLSTFAPSSSPSSSCAEDPTLDRDQIDSSPDQPSFCAGGCKEEWVGDGQCDQKCNVAACNFDDNDCMEIVNRKGRASVSGSASAQASVSGSASIQTCSWECGIPNALNSRRKLIVGGEVAEPNEYPWMVLLKKNGHAYCGGSIIDRHWILTAAHCVMNSQPENWKVVAAEHEKDKDASEVEFEVSDIIVHNLWDQVTFDNDIAIMRIAGELPCDNDQIKPMCFPTFDEVSVNGWFAWVVGWGLDKEYAKQTTSTLHEVALETFEANRCLDESRLQAVGGMTDNMYCAWDPVNGGKDSCQGDSGGPMFIDLDPMESHKYVQIGIVSWGYGCAIDKFPGVYTRLPNYGRWLAEYTFPNFVAINGSLEYCTRLMTEEDVYTSGCHDSCAACGYGHPGQGNKDTCIACKNPQHTIDIQDFTTCTGSCVDPRLAINSYQSSVCQPRYPCVREFYRAFPVYTWCNSFNCGADAAYVPNAATVEGNDFATCCRCQFGSNLLWGAHANGTFHGDSNPWSVEMWLDIPKDVTMEEIQWANAQNNNLRYKRNQTTKWNSRLEGECRTRWTLDESLDTFFGTGSRFTYDRDEDRLEGMFEFKADRSMSRIISGYEHVYVRHITQDVPVLFSLEKTAKVEATFKTSVTALEYDIAITGVAEETFSENGEIVLDFNIISSSCMEKSVTLQTGQDVINGGITSTWSDESLWHPVGMDTASCSQDVTVTFKRKDGKYNLPLVFEFQIQAADNSGKKIPEEVNLHIEEPSILDSLPIQTTMSIYLTEDRINPADSFGLGHTVYGRIKTTTVVDVDSIVLSSLVLEQVGYDNVEQTFDIMQLPWAEYKGEYPEGSDHFDFSFMIGTDLHITASDSNNHLASIKAAIAVTYKDESHTRRQLATDPPSAEAKSDATMTATNSFAITAPPKSVGALFEITPAHKSHFLKWSAAGGFLALFLYCVPRQMKYQDESYSPLLVDDEI